MWILGLLIIAVPLLAAGGIASVIWYLASPKHSRPEAKRLIAVTIGFAIIPLGSLAVLSLVAQALQKSDHQLYEEVFATYTAAPDQAMLFDDFGRGKDREIYMRIFPDDGEREFLLSLPNANASSMRVDEFVKRGDQHGFTWWISADSEWASDRCDSVRLFEADGFNGWKELRIAECRVGATGQSSAAQQGPIYVIAWHRQ
jgi:hypothetical protein